MIENVNTAKIQIFAIIGSIIILVFLIELIRKKKIKEEYSLLWLFFGFIFLALSIWRNGLEVISRFLGIAYAPASLLLILVIAIFFVLIHFSIVISTFTENNRKLIQELGILKAELKEVRDEVINKEKRKDDKR